MRRWGSLVRKGPRCKSRALQVYAWRWGFRYSSSENEPSSAKSETPNETDNKEHSVEPTHTEVVKQAYSNWARVNKLAPHDDFLVGAKQAYHTLGHLFSKIRTAPTNELAKEKLDRALEELGLADSVGDTLKEMSVSFATSDNLFALFHEHDHILNAKMIDFEEEAPEGEVPWDQSTPAAKVTVQYVAVGPPKRYYLHYDFFYQRVRGAETEVERANFAKALSMVMVYIPLYAIDVIMKQLTGKPLEFPCSKGAANLLGLPEGLLGHPPSFRKELTFKLVNGERWVIDDANIFGLKEVLSESEYAD